jgi:hypothetical protein
MPIRQQGPAARGYEANRIGRVLGKKDMQKAWDDMLGKPPGRGTRSYPCLLVAAARPRMDPQSGLMLIWALVIGVVVLGLIFSGNMTLYSSEKRAQAEFRALDQAVDVARAGIVDVHAWFRRQAGQPVKTFAPIRDLTTFPPINDTDEPAIGLVREFEFTPNLVGRYEIRKFADLDGNGRADPGEGVADVSSQRSLPGQGTVWQLEAWGIVYERLDEDKAWNEAPNRRVAGALMSTEIRRITLSPPGKAALCCARGDDVTVGSKAVVNGAEEAGIVFPPDTGTPSIAGTVEGAIPTSAIPGYDGSPMSVFGVSLQDLKAMATVRLSAGHSMPVPVPELSLVYAEGLRQVNSTGPLRGTGVLVVNGDLEIQAGSNSYFKGLIYVTGSLKLKAPALVHGTIIVEGSITMSGTGDTAEVIYDEEVLQELRLEMGGYRITRPLLRMDPVLIGGPK